MNKLAKHILALLHKGYPIELLYNFDTAREALRQNGIEASPGQVRCALLKHFKAIYEAFTGSRILTGSQLRDAFAHPFDDEDEEALDEPYFDDGEVRNFITPYRFQKD